MIAIERVALDLPDGFAALRASARAEGYSQLERLAADWIAGTVRFDRAGEGLRAAYVDGALAGMGGITLDPVERGALRMRRFYVAASHRRHGVGRALAEALLAMARAAQLPVMVNAAAGSVAFWEGLGFARDSCDGHTHRFADRR